MTYLCARLQIMANEEFKNDALLVAALKFDSHEAFVKIFRRYYPDLVHFTARFFPDKSLCEDIVQEAFIKVWTNRKKLRQTPPSGHICYHLSRISPSMSCGTGK